MNKQTIAVVVGAVGLFVVAVIGALAFTGGGEAHPVMTMPNGETMEHHLMSQMTETQPSP
jgi:hypothetical protein